MMKKNISYIPMDHTLEIWLLEKLLREPPGKCLYKRASFRYSGYDKRRSILAVIRSLRR